MKTSKKYLEKDTRKWKAPLSAWIVRMSSVTHVPKAFYRFGGVPVKITISFFTGIERAILRLIWNHKRLQRAKTILSRQNDGGINFYGAIVIKPKQHKNRHVDQCNENEDPNM